jgi:hypothetical protein
VESASTRLYSTAARPALGRKGTSRSSREALPCLFSVGERQSCPWSAPRSWSSRWRLFERRAIGWPIACSPRCWWWLSVSSRRSPSVLRGSTTAGLACRSRRSRFPSPWDRWSTVTPSRSSADVCREGSVGIWPQPRSSSAISPCASPCRWPRSHVGIERSTSPSSIPRSASPPSKAWPAIASRR